MSKKDGSIDDRKSQRIDVQLLVDYHSQNGHYLFDFCRDLGTGGVFIETTNPLPMGESVNLTFTIPDSKETLVASGKVIWVQEAVPEKELTAGMGVQFDEFTPDQREILTNFIKRYHGEGFGTDKGA